MIYNYQQFANAGSVVNTSVNYVNAESGATTAFSAPNTLAAEMKDFYRTELLENTKPNLIYSQFGQHVTLPAGHKGSVEFRKWNTFAKANQLVEGVIPNGQKFGMTTIVGTVNQYGTYVSISDKLELRAYDDIIGGATAEMASSMARTAEFLTRDALLTGTNVLYCDNIDRDTGTYISTPVRCKEMEAGSTVHMASAAIGPSTGITDAEIDAETFGAKVGEVAGSYTFTYDLTNTTWKISGAAATLADYGITVTGTPANADVVIVKYNCYVAVCRLTPTMINKAVTLLKAAGVPTIGSDYVAIVHPSVAHDIRNDPGWTAAHQYAAPNEIFNGEIGRLHGVRFIENSNAPILGVKGVTSALDDSYVNASRGRTYATYFLGRDAFAIIDPEGGGAEMIVHDKDEIGGPLNQFSTIGYKFESNGATILYPERVLRVMSCSSFSATDSCN